MKWLEKEHITAWMERIRAPYRLIIRNDETLEERGSFRLSMFNVYVLLSSIVVLVALAVVLLIAYTPIKRYLPGFAGGGGSDKREVMQLARQVQELEKALKAQEKYTENVRKMLVGDVQTEKDVQQLNTDATPNAAKPKTATVRDEDWQLRQEEEFNQLAEVARQDRKATNFGAQDKSIEQLFFIAPVRGEISAPFSLEKKHLGIDILAPKNTAIRASMDGYVFMSDWTLETGNTIGIQHSNNIITFYKHNSVNLKKAGSFVRAGEAIGIIGNTGDLSSGPHLHFELWARGKPVDPADYVTF